MANLKTTHPHFVRCLIPNERKAPGERKEERGWGQGWWVWLPADPAHLPPHQA